MRRFDYSKLATTKWDMDILMCVAKIHECKGRQDLYVRQKPVELDRLTEIARVQSTEASNRIEGIVTTSTRLNQLVSDKTTPRNRNEGEIIGYRDVLKTIHESYSYIPIRPSYLLQLHRDLMKPAGLSYGGQFKNTQNYIKEIRSDGTETIRFMPVAPHETPEAIQSICDAYQHAIAMEIIDPLLLIPAFIIDFLCIHPFNDGNGRMSRLLTLLLLYQNGYTVGKYISIEKQIEKTKDVYYDVLNDANHGWHEEDNDPVPFIRYILKTVLSCYIEFENRVDMMGNTSHKSTAYDIVKQYISGKIGKFTSADCIQHCPSLSRASVLAAIKILVEEGFIIKLGTGRSTEYVRTQP